MTDALTTFLRARLDEDLAAAQAATEQAGEAAWHIMDDGRFNKIAPGAGAPPGIDIAIATTTGSVFAEHIARHDPARVLAEVEAKRRMIQMHGIVYRDIGWLEGSEEEGSEISVCGQCVPRHSHFARRQDVPEGPCLTLRLLASVYAEHPDYLEAWRP